MTPSARVPLRDDVNLCMLFRSPSFLGLLRHDKRAGVDGCEVTAARPGAVAGCVDVLDEVADDGCGVRGRVVAVALTWVVEAVALPGPAGDVEGGEAGDGHGGGSIAVKRAEWGDE